MRLHPKRLLKRLKPRTLLHLYILSTILWIIQSTLLPHLLNPTSHLNGASTMTQIPSTLTNRTIQFLTAHPDDEVMFFTPIITELLKAEHNNVLKLTCFSQGNGAGLGSIRHDELYTSLRILGFQQENIKLINDERKFKDSMSLSWDKRDILAEIDEDTQVVITFDQGGVSGHPNHISLFNSAQEWLQVNESKVVYVLKSWTLWEKYSSTLLTNYQLLARYLGYDSVSDPVSDSNFTVFANLYDSLLGLTAMINGHYSQMVWFRWIWVTVSKYGNSNELVRL
ncbi:hypothetical protein WICPIJ_001624 [Wickerhamomyces pijperi]|uniref:N-acetylglucosaminylphosphatidylinositol deacetylase n=1 Tax=Wickerhamomyces pijperi TaxID=599730 RepID=A0A9P8TPQ3_WICPI|nr:hypothetical protein WICPIJ_001624 [Wickerhamomyces pijperi]